MRGVTNNIKKAITPNNPCSAIIRPISLCEAASMPVSFKRSSFTCPTPIPKKGLFKNAPNSKANKSERPVVISAFSRPAASWFA